MKFLRLWIVAVVVALAAVPASSDQLILTVTAQSTNQSSASFEIPSGTRGGHFYVRRTSAACGVACSIGLQLVRVEYGSSDRELFRWATVDFNATDFLGAMVNPSSAVANEYSTVTPAVTTGGGLRGDLPPGTYKLKTSNVNAVSMSYEVWMQLF